jgi:uncharacterized Tic20 family protein
MGSENAEAESGVADLVNQDSRNFAVIMEILSFFFGFIPPLVVYLVKSNDKFLREQSTKTLNATINLLIFIVVATILNATVIGLILGIPMLVVAGIYALVYFILAAIENSKGKIANFPFCIKIIK